MKVSTKVGAYQEILLTGRYTLETVSARGVREDEPDESISVLPRIIEGPPDPETGEEVIGMTLNAQFVNTRPDECTAPDFVTGPDSRWESADAWREVQARSFAQFQRAHDVDGSFDTEDLVGKRYGASLDVKGKGENRSTFVKFWGKPVEGGEPVRGRDEIDDDDVPF